jgi:hypothetical protein
MMMAVIIGPAMHVLYIPSSLSFTNVPLCLAYMGGFVWLFVSSLVSTLASFSPFSSIAFQL